MRFFESNSVQIITTGKSHEFEIDKDRKTREMNFQDLYG